MIWLACGLITLVVVAALLWPLLRAPQAAPERAAYDMAVFQDQLKELERDVERGVITAAEAEAARTEIQRRLLGASKLQAAPATDSPNQRAILIAVVAVVVPFAALGLYATVGAPNLVANPPQVAKQDDNHGNDDMAILVDRLAAKVRENPSAPEGWSLLARSYRQLARFADAAEAYQHYIALVPEDGDAYSGYGEAVTAAADGAVTPQALSAFVRALQIDRTDPRARFYVGISRAQAGAPRDAIAIWREMTASAPKDAQWVDTVRQQMGTLAQEAGVMPMSVEPRHALDVLGEKGGAPAPAIAVPAPKAAPAPASASASPADPSDPDVSALKNRFTDEQLAMIKGMVGGLAARLENEPDDYDGWMRLGRAYVVLENIDGAKTAYGKAAALKPRQIEPRLQLADLMARDTDFDKRLPAALVKVAQEIYALDNNQPEALFVLGLVKAQANDTKGARDMWKKALTGTPEKAPLHAELTRRLDALR